MFLISALNSGNVFEGAQKGPEAVNAVGDQRVVLQVPAADERRRGFKVLVVDARLVEGQDGLLVLFEPQIWRAIRGAHQSLGWKGQFISLNVSMTGAATAAAQGTTWWTTGCAGDFCSGGADAAGAVTPVGTAGMARCCGALAMSFARRPDLHPEADRTVFAQYPEDGHATR